jgi:hypothetical protein
MATLLAGQHYNVTSRWVNGAGNVVITGGVNKGLIGSPATSDGVTNTGTPGAGEPFAPSKANILADIQALSGTVGPNDVVVIYFSGHGTQDTSTTPAHEFFDPYGAVMQYTGPTGDGNYYDWPAPSVRDDDLRAAFSAINTPRKVLILDTCNSGGFIGNQAEVDWSPPAYTDGPAVVGPGTLVQAIANYATMQASLTGLSPYGAQVLSAAGRDELSYEAPPPYAHGIMTYYVLQGLAGAADLNHDGHITVLEAFSYAKAGVDTGWNAPYGSSTAFEPHVSGGPVDFELF